MGDELLSRVADIESQLATLKATIERNTQPGMKGELVLHVRPWSIV